MISAKCASSIVQSTSEFDDFSEFRNYFIILNHEFLINFSVNLSNTHDLIIN